MSTLIFEVLEPFTTRQEGRITRCEPGQRFCLTSEQAKQVLGSVGNKIRLVTQGELDSVIGTVVQASLEFLNEAGERVAGVGPWIVVDTIVFDWTSGFIAGRWLCLQHGQEWRWVHESRTTTYRCPMCKQSGCWWSEHTVLCVACIPPSRPQWGALWREVGDLTIGVMPNDPCYLQIVEALSHCDEAFQRSDYSGFQAGLVRLRWAWARQRQGGCNP